MKVRISIPGAVVTMEMEDNQAVKTFRELAGRLIGTEPSGVVKIRPPEALQEKVKAFADGMLGNYLSTADTGSEDVLAPAQSDESAGSAEPTEPAEAADQPVPHDTPAQQYKGFLYIHCEKCEAVKGFCAKEPINVNRCKCGHLVELKDLVPLYVHCECGRRSKYMTNVPDPLFDINCINCGAPVPVRWNSNKRLYETIK